MHPGDGKGRIGDHIGHPFACQGLADIAAGDVLLEPGEDGAEGGRGVAKQRRVGHTARIERGENDAGARVQPAMQLLGGDHVAELAVLVSLAGLEGLAIGHGDRRLETGGKAGKITQIGRGRDGNLAAEFLRVGGHGAQDHDPTGRMLGVPEIVQQPLNQQKVAKMIGGHRNFVTLGRPLRLLEPG